MVIQGAGRVEAGCFDWSLHHRIEYSTRLISARLTRAHHTDGVQAITGRYVQVPPGPTLRSIS